MTEGFTLQQLEAALDGAGVGIWRWEPATARFALSSVTAQLLGAVSHEQLGWLDFIERIHQADRAPALASFEETRHQDAALVVECRVAAGSGPERWLRFSGALDVSGGDVSGTVRDVTDERRRMRDLARSEFEYRIYSEFASDYVYVVEIEQGALQAPSILMGSFERTTGYTPQQVIDVGGWLQVIHPDDRAGLGPIFAGVADGTPMVVEYRIIKPDGRESWLRDHVRPVVVDGVVTRIVGGVQDITVRRSLEAQLGHAQRMEALAHMASSVSHDFNNILMVISASADIISMRAPRDESTHALLDDIRAASRRGAELTRALLTFGRKSPARAQVLSLPELVRTSERILERAVGERVRVALQLPSEALLVAADESQLQLMLLNLAVNARAAMPHGGCLAIRVRRGDPDDACEADLATRELAILEVEDNGTGIEPDVLPRIFEPFFTTKGPAEGNGLGLATCYGIVTQARGSIRVKTKPGVGSTFTVYLPTTDQAVASLKPSELRESAGGHERILLVEDDPAVRHVTARLLEDHGYAVTQASSVAAARLAFQRGEVQLLITDVRLPDGCGATLARELCDAHRDLKVMLISGFADDAALRVIRDAGFTLLHKPFDAALLARTVRAALAEQRPAPVA